MMRKERGGGTNGARADGDSSQFISPRRVRSTELLNEGRQLIIEHAGREYRLQVTRNGKLILTA